MTERKIKAFREKAEGWTGPQEELADKFGITKGYVQYLFEKFEIKTWKRIDAPKNARPGTTAKGST